ncbi:MAG TPA: hypothetical protein DEQ38_13180 [Elusimicrobia bacterium]|nr:MAG: hypothetical protein A2089_14285 [Elusimicrobia bacterium GWD2_63_28]HCC49050.1 hypothetical protein [Elusimicrobiota bacterium]
MKRTLSLSALCLAALLAPSAAPAFPNSAQRHVVDVNGVPYTVLQDHMVSLRWYYAPAAARLAEYGKQLPSLFLIKYQAPSPSNKTMLEENAQLFVTLALTADAGTLAALSKAVLALPVMADYKGDPKLLNISALPLSEARLKLFGPDGSPLVEAPSREGIGATPSVEQAQFAVPLRNFRQDAYELLVNRAGGLKIAVDYKYMAAGEKDGKWVPAPVSGRAEGSLGLGDYADKIRSQSIMIVPAQGYEYAMLALPAVGRDLAVKKVNLAVFITDPQGKPVHGMQAVFQWQLPAAGESRAAGDNGWRDLKSNQVNFAFFPVKALLEMAKAGGKNIQDYKFSASVEMQPLAGVAPKAEAETPLFEGGAPVSVPAPYFKELQLSPTFLTFGESAEEEIYLTRIQASCGKASYNGKFGRDSVTPFGFYFPKDCAPKLSLDNINKKGKNVHSVKNAAVRDLPGSVLYLTNDGEYGADGPL